MPNDDLELVAAGIPFDEGELRLGCARKALRDTSQSGKSPARSDPAAVSAIVDCLEVRIAPDAWAGTNAQTKELVTRALAIYVSPANPMVTLYDEQSASELASYGPFQGFSVK